jgi:diguanylate cyclase (GGDEF)-like protein/PAS domain S-box-containing protein
MYQALPRQPIEQNQRLTDIATRKVIRLSPSDTLGAAARIMAYRRLSSIVVSDASDKPVGIVTESNITSAMLAESPAETPLSNVMSSPVVTVPEHVTCLDAYQLCQREGIHHLVIVDDSGQLCGVVSDTDFRQHLYLTTLAGRRQVLSVMSQSVFKIEPDTALIAAIELMKTHRSRCVVVVEAEMPLGIVTERDIVRLYSRNSQRADMLISQVMSAPVVTITREATINEAAELMLERSVRHLVVVDAHGRVRGLLSEHDLTYTMTRHLIDDKLNAESAFLQTLINTIPDLVWLKDMNGVYLDCNPQFERLFGAKKNAIIGKTDYDFVDKETADSFRKHDLIAIRNDRPSVNEEWVTFADDGHRELVETFKTPMYNSQRELIGVLGVARNITERKRMESQLKEYRKQLEGRVAEEATKFRALVEQSLVGIYIIQDQTFRYVNAGFADMFGYESPEEIIGCIPIQQLVARQDRDFVVENLNLRLNGHVDRLRFSFNGIKRDGSVISVEVHGRLIEYQDQPAVIGTLVDVTDARRNQLELECLVDKKAAELNRSEEKLRTLIESIPDPIQFKDGQGRWLESNMAAKRAFRLETVDCNGKTDVELSALVPPSAKEALLRCHSTDEQAWRAKALHHVEEVVTLNDGNKLYFDVIKKPLFHDDGERTGLVIVARNVTELRRSQEALVERERLYRAIFDQAPSGIELIDMDNLRIVEANPAACRMLGYSHKEYLGLRLTDIQADQGQSAVVAGINELETHGRDAFENRHLCKNGDILDVEVNARLLNLPGKRLIVGVWQDITERKQAEKALRLSLEAYRGLVQKIPVGVYKFKMFSNDKVRFEYVSQRWCEMTDVSEAEVMADPQAAFARIHPDELSHFLDLNKKAGENLSRFLWEGRICKKNGEIRWLHIESQPTLLEDGEILWDGIQYDVTDRVTAENTLRINASVFENSQEAIMITDADNIIVDVNRAFTLITGYRRDDVIGRDPNILNSGRHEKSFYQAMWQSLLQNKAWRGEVWNRRKSGDIYVELLSISVICDDKGRVQRYVGVFSDISYLKEYEEELSRVAHYDALTGVPNRVLLADRMKQAIAQSVRDQSLVAFCYLDLDGFKAINDLLGHEAGDHVLVEISKRIQHTLRGGDTLARLGGDEFVVLLNLERGEDCRHTLDRLLQVLSKPITVMDKASVLSASIGVSVYPTDDADPDTLLRHADQAMYVAKQSGKNCYYVYDPELDLRARNHNEFLKNVRHGLEHGQFELHYQPKVNLSTRRLVGAEALIRWRHPEQGLLAPIDFLRPIENTELDVDIGNWVIVTALAQIYNWQQLGLDIEVSINISAYHLESPGFVEVLKQHLARYPKLPANKLQIEVLENAALNDLTLVRKVIEACRQLGVGFALDDFGTGYASLSYLSRLPVDILKIDQSFVRDMLHDKGDKTIIQGIIALAHAFERRIVAEGIENGEQYQMLQELGCEIGQGYGIARPMPAEALSLWRADMMPISE